MLNDVAGLERQLPADQSPQAVLQHTISQSSIMCAADLGPKMMPSWS